MIKSTWNILFARKSEADVLSSGVALLSPQFEQRRFAYVAGDVATSSGGPFAAGFFRRDDIEVGLIVRNRHELGCPNYSVSKGYAGHTELVSTLGRAGEEQLIHGGGLKYVARHGGDPFIALQNDLESIVLAALDRSEEAFRESLALAVKLAHARLGF